MGKGLTPTRVGPTWLPAPHPRRGDGWGLVSRWGCRRRSCCELRASQPPPKPRSVPLAFLLCSSTPQSGPPGLTGDHAAGLPAPLLSCRPHAGPSTGVGLPGLGQEPPPLAHTPSASRSETLYPSRSLSSAADVAPAGPQPVFLQRFPPPPLPVLSPGNWVVVLIFFFLSPPGDTAT